MPGNDIATVSDGKFEYRFVTHSEKERRRALRMLEKEKGTIAWIDREIRPEDVFFDIGANIGVYTIFAAYRLGRDGRAVAFEPHIPNANSLIENIRLNGFDPKVQLVTAALTSKAGFDRFNYQSLVVASSTSQFGNTSYEGESFEPAFVEIKYGCRVDDLCDQGLIPRPDLIKIDVDGLDFEVLVGMKGLLASADRPRSLQVELGSDNKAQTLELLDSLDYRLVEKHWTTAGLDFIAQGNDPEDYPHYGIFNDAR